MRRGVALLIVLGGCAGDGAPAADAKEWTPFKAPALPYAPLTYACPRAATAPVIDGRLDDAAWQAVPWTADFVDIEGDLRPTPRHRCRVKMLWDDEYVYFAADLDEPHVWATRTKRDSIIFHDNDFEVFLDPDQDTHDYFEFEINAFGTEWDLYLGKPYRDGGPALHQWDMPGMKSAVQVDGTINDPSDTDRGWTVEIAFPWADLQQGAGAPCPPNPGDRWRVNFSRVQWRTHVDGGRYVKDVDPETGENLPEDNWVWSPQGVINMHYPERWGLVEFRNSPGGGAPVAQTAWEGASQLLRQIYYAQRSHRRRTGAYSSDIDVLAKEGVGVGRNLLLGTQEPFDDTLGDDYRFSRWGEIAASREGFHATAVVTLGWHMVEFLTIHEDGRIRRRKPSERPE